MPWIGIQPGDIGWDGGSGIFGWVIRRGTGVYGHTWVYHRLISVARDGSETWETVEAGPSGVKLRVRTRPPVKVVRLWRTEGERSRILEASEACIGAKYGWGEIVRLALHTAGIKVKGWKDNPNRMICSNHTARSVAAATPGLRASLPYPPQHIWPQRLAEWSDWVLWTRAQNKKKRGK
jgi:hypothetical protein